MSLIDENLVAQISGLLNRPQPTTTTASVTRDTFGRGDDLAARFMASGSRRELVSIARQMYDEDTRYETIINTLARDATSKGFDVVVENDDRAQELADNLFKRLGLADRLDDWARLTLRDGDTFLEVGVDRDRMIAEITRKPTLDVHRNSDRFDRFPDPSHAFWMSDRPFVTQPIGPDVVWFAEWQIVHARWAHDENSQYGRPLLASGRKAYKRMTEGELDVAVRRKTRAGVRYHHVVDGDETDLERYQRMNRRALENPGAAAADFFSNKPGSITALHGDSNIGNITDIEHHIATFFLGSPVPMALLGYGNNLNRDVLDKQKEQYDESLSSVVTWVKRQFIVPLLELQWLLAGILPDNLEYQVLRPSKAIVTPQDILHMAQAAQMLLAMNIPYDVVIRVMVQYLPGVTLDMLDIPSNEVPPGQTDAGRLDAITQQLMTLLKKP